MMRIILYCLTLSLAACGGTRGSEDTRKAPASADSAPEDVIGAPLHQALDKAHSVEDLNGQRKGGLDAAIDEAN
ncbi:MAG: hypothetical protein ABI661_01220 [Gammaproteobacteria bacterium]